MINIVLGILMLANISLLDMEYVGWWLVAHGVLSQIAWGVRLAMKNRYN